MSMGNFYGLIRKWYATISCHETIERVNEFRECAWMSAIELGFERNGKHDYRGF